jgi:hypothetical protein
LITGGRTDKADKPIQPKADTKATAKTARAVEKRSIKRMARKRTAKKTTARKLGK